ncbi:MAG: hypothetical protein IT286_01945 [Proteobacteria bacterium]|jgi:hypothetical protein|nr:hypothetical protein [Pseudomonadota bacterium]
MNQQSKILRSTLMVLGISFLSYCGNHQAGSAGGAYISPASIIKPDIKDPTETEKADVQVFLSLNKVAGDLLKAVGGGARNQREAADLICEQARTADMEDREIRAFISINASDQIVDMPSKFGLPTDKPFIGDLGVRIADNFAALFGSALEASLGMAVDGFEVDEKFWTGTDENGFVDAENCNEWKSEAGIGAVGLSTAIDQAWIKSENEACGSVFKLICLAF